MVKFNIVLKVPISDRSNDVLAQHPGQASDTGNVASPRPVARRVTHVHSLDDRVLRIVSSTVARSLSLQSLISNTRARYRSAGIAHSIDTMS